MQKSGECILDRALSKAKPDKAKICRKIGWLETFN
jgi:hypothetical protein